MALSYFAGKVALVTWGSRGIGAAISKRLAEDVADVAFSYVASKADTIVRELEAAAAQAFGSLVSQGVIMPRDDKVSSKG